MHVKCFFCLFLAVSSAKIKLLCSKYYYINYYNWNYTCVAFFLRELQSITVFNLLFLL